MSAAENEWIFDSVINFVKSPLWKVPITSFINENCVIFDDEEENKLEYTDIHKKFKKIVEEMLTNMLNDIGIDEETFAKACIKASDNPVHKMLLSEIMAVDNFVAFKKLMLKRNRELSQEALQLMNAKEAGIDPNMVLDQPNYGQASNEDDEIAKAIQASLELEKNKSDPSASKSTTEPTDEDEMMRRALEASKQEYEMMQKAQKKDAEEAKTKLKKKSEAPKSKSEKPKEDKPKKDKPKKEKKPEPVSEPPKTKAPTNLAPVGKSKAAPINAGFDIQKHAEETEKLKKKNEEEKAAAIEKKAMSKEEMKERMAKLRQQRDLLLKKKQNDLQKEWDSYGDKTSGSGDNRKDMIQKGLNALQIKEGGITYQTEEQKEQAKKRAAEQKQKDEEAKKSAAK